MEVIRSLVSLSLPLLQTASWWNLPDLLRLALRKSTNTRLNGSIRLVKAWRVVDQKNRLPLCMSIHEFLEPTDYTKLGASLSFIWREDAVRLAQGTSPDQSGFLVRCNLLQRVFLGAFACTVQGNSASSTQQIGAPI